MGQNLFTGGLRGFDPFPCVNIWLWVKKMPTLGDHRFGFIFPFTKPGFFRYKYPVFLTHGHIHTKHDQSLAGANKQKLVMAQKHAASMWINGPSVHCSFSPWFFILTLLNHSWAFWSCALFSFMISPEEPKYLLLFRYMSSFYIERYQDSSLQESL